MISLYDDGCLLHVIADSETYVNGERTVEAWLLDGDCVQAGNLEFVVRLSGLNDEHVQRPDAFAHESTMASIDRTAQPDRSVLLRRKLGHRHMIFEPASGQIDSGVMAERLATRMPLYLLCRFDRSYFPLPPGLQDCRDCVPATGDRHSMQFLPLLFQSNEVGNPHEMIARGMDAGCLLALSTKLAKQELLEYLRSSRGLFNSPRSLLAAITEETPRDAAAILGPVSGILLGCNTNWKFLADCREFRGPEAFGFSSNNPFARPEARCFYRFHSTCRVAKFMDTSASCNKSFQVIAHCVQYRI